MSDTPKLAPAHAPMNQFARQGGQLLVGGMPVGRLAALVHVADDKAREFPIGFSGDRQKLSMSEFARRVVLNCDRIDNHRDEIAQRVDAMLSEGRVDEAVVAA